MGGIAQGVASKRANDATSKANKDLTGRMEQSRDAYAGLRPQVAAGKQQALSQLLGLFEPSNAMAREMTGGRYAMDLEPIRSNSPLSVQPAPNMLSRGYHGGQGDAFSTQADIAKAREMGYDTAALERAYQGQGGDGAAAATRSSYAQAEAKRKGETDPFVLAGLKPRK